VVQDDQVGVELVRHDPRVVTRAGGLDLKATVAAEYIDEQFHDLRIVIHHQDAGLAAFQRVRRNAVVLHELDQGFPRDAAKTRTRHPETLQPAGVKAADDRLLRHLADLSSFTGRKYALHGRAPYANATCFITSI